MTQKATITLYEVKYCGYFDTPLGRKPRFGDLNSILSDLNKWGKGQYLEDTKTFDPEKDSDIFPIYLADIAYLKGDWLVAMWNAVPKSEGGVAAVSGRSHVGSPSVEVSPSKNGTIPGFATYFWFLPDQKILATIRLKRPFTGQQAMQQYMESFIRYFSSHVVHDESTKNSDDVSPLGYSHTTGGEPLPLHPRFRTQLCRLPSKIDQLAKQATKIYKISKKESLDLVASTNLTRWEKISSLVFSPSYSLPSTNRKKAKLEYTTDISVTEEEILKIAADWEKAGGVESDTNIGFKLRGESSFIWLSGSIARDEISVELTNTTPEFYDPAILLKSLRNHRDHMLSMVKK
ncbi:MAG TPA: hypothetical protein GXX62_01385 [Alcaligenaceae bacterium]|nr:hypothetical protein [Alcaligenaceae bacterium]